MTTSKPFLDSLSHHYIDQSVRLNEIHLNSVAFVMDRSRKSPPSIPINNTVRAARHPLSISRCDSNRYNSDSINRKRLLHYDDSYIIILSFVLLHDIIIILEYTNICIIIPFFEFHQQCRIGIIRLIYVPSYYQHHCYYIIDTYN